MKDINVEELSQKVFKTICDRLCCKGQHKGYDGFRCFFCGKSTASQYDNFCTTCRTEIPAIIAEGYYKVLRPLVSHLEPPDYKIPLERAFLINEIHTWYDKKFAEYKNYEIRISVFDLIADFVMDRNKPLPSKESSR